MLVRRSQRAQVGWNRLYLLFSRWIPRPAFCIPTLSLDTVSDHSLSKRLWGIAPLRGTLGSEWAYRAYNAAAEIVWKRARASRGWPANPVDVPTEPGQARRGAPSPQNVGRRGGDQRRDGL